MSDKPTFDETFHGIVELCRHNDWILAQHKIYEISSTDLSFKQRTRLDQLARIVGTRDIEEINSMTRGIENSFSHQSALPHVFSVPYMISLLGKRVVIKLISSLMIFWGINMLVVWFFTHHLTLTEAIVSLIIALLTTLTIVAVILMFKIARLETIVNIVLAIITSLFIPGVGWLIRLITKQHTP